MLRGATGQGGALQRRGGERRTRGPMEGRSRPARRSMRVDPALRGGVLREGRSFRGSLAGGWWRSRLPAAAPPLLLCNRP